MTFAHTVSKNVKMFRKKGKLSQQELAKMTGLSVRYISRLETASPNVTVDVIERLAKAFGCSYCQLVQDQEQIENQNQEVLKLLDDIINAIQRLKTLQFVYLQNSQEFKKICELAPQALILVDDDANIVYLNLEAKKLFKCENKDVIGKNIYKIFVPQNYSSYYQSLFEKHKSNNLSNVVIDFTAQTYTQEHFKAQCTLTQLEINSKIFTLFLITKVLEQIKNQEVKSLKDFPLSLKDQQNIIKADGIIFINLDKKTFKVCYPNQCFLPCSEHLKEPINTDVTAIQPSQNKESFLQEYVQGILQKYLLNNQPSSDLYSIKSKIELLNPQIIHFYDDKVLVALYKVV